MNEEELNKTITIRASQEFKDDLKKLAETVSKELTVEVRISDLVRLGLAWVFSLDVDNIVELLTEENALLRYLG